MLNCQVQGWPTTLDQAVDRILSKLTGLERKAVRTTPENDLDLLHLGLGTRAESSRRPRRGLSGPRTHAGKHDDNVEAGLGGESVRCSPVAPWGSWLDG
jgi:hypothetical protein